MLLALRELNMSIEEIQSYMNNRSAEAFHKIVESKTAQIDEEIKKLKELRGLLENKEKDLCICQQTDMGDIRLIDCPKEYLLLSNPITEAYDEKDLAVLMEHSQNMRKHRLFNKCYGCMISAEKVLSGNLDEYVTMITVFCGS